MRKGLLPRLAALAILIFATWPAPPVAGREPAPPGRDASVPAPRASSYGCGDSPLEAQPPALHANVTLGSEKTLPLKLSNVGAVTITFQLTEMPDGGLGPMATAPPRPQPATSIAPRRVELTPSSSPAGRSMPLSSWVPSGGVSLVLDDGSMEGAIGVNLGSTAYQFIWLNRFTPAVDQYPFRLDQVSLIWPSGQTTVGAAVELVVYADPDGDGDASNGTYLASYPVTVQVADSSTWDDYTLTPPLLLNGPGDVLIGAINRYVQSGVTPYQHPASLDETASQGRSWLGWWSGDPPTPPVLPPDGDFRTTESFGFPGNFMIRGSGTTTDPVTWLSESPITGTVPAGYWVPVDVTFSALPALAAWPTYPVFTATLAIATDNPCVGTGGTLYVPVSMTVTSPVFLPLVLRWQLE